MRILVIGGTRFIGPSVVTELQELGHDVTLFHRGQTGTAAQGVTEILGDRRKLTEHTDELRKLQPDVVLDMIAVIEEDARQLAEVFTGYAKRIVLASSMDVYRAYGRLLGKEQGPPDETPLTEESPLREKLYPYRGETLRLSQYDFAALLGTGPPGPGRPRAGLAAGRSQASGCDLGHSPSRFFA